MQEKNFFDKKTKEGRQHRELLKLGILLAGMLIAGGCYLGMQGKEENHLVLEESKEEYPQTDEKESDIIESTTESETELFLYVHVCGQVKEPGVYQLTEGARVFDAVQMAGGMTEEAFEEAVNLAETVTDGEQIRIPDRIEAESSLLIEQQTESGLINLNTATKEQLMTLTGIGESRAEDILAYREKNGGFQSKEDIMKVPGIKEAAFSKIESKIIVK